MVWQSGVCAICFNFVCNLYTKLLWLCIHFTQFTTHTHAPYNQLCLTWTHLLCALDVLFTKKNQQQFVLEEKKMRIKKHFSFRYCRMERYFRRRRGCSYSFVVSKYRCFFHKVYKLKSKLLFSRLQNTLVFFSIPQHILVCSFVRLLVINCNCSRCCYCRWICF